MAGTVRMGAPPTNLEEYKAIYIIISRMRRSEPMRPTRHPRRPSHCLQLAIFPSHPARQSLKWKEQAVLAGRAQARPCRACGGSASDIPGTSVLGRNGGADCPAPCHTRGKHQTNVVSATFDLGSENETILRQHSVKSPDFVVSNNWEALVVGQAMVLGSYSKCGCRLVFGPCIRPSFTPLSLELAILEAQTIDCVTALVGQVDHVRGHRKMQYLLLIPSRLQREVEHNVPGHAGLLPVT